MIGSGGIGVMLLLFLLEFLMWHVDSNEIIEVRLLPSQPNLEKNLTIEIGNISKYLVELVLPVTFVMTDKTGNTSSHTLNLTEEQLIFLPFTSKQIVIDVFKGENLERFPKYFIFNISKNKKIKVKVKTEIWE